MNLCEAEIGHEIRIEKINLSAPLKKYAECRGIFEGNGLKILCRHRGRAIVSVNGGVFVLPPHFCENIEVAFLRMAEGEDFEQKGGENGKKFIKKMLK